MADFTIEALYTSMQAGGEQAYREKERASWTLFDWLCALRDGLTGANAAEHRDEFDDIRRSIDALLAMKAAAASDNLTQTQMMARGGRRLREVYQKLRDLSSLNSAFFGENERELLTAAVQSFTRTDEPAAIAAAEQSEQVSAYRQAARTYLQTLAAQRRELDGEAADTEQSRERRRELTSLIYVTYHRMTTADTAIPHGYPAVFNRYEIAAEAKLLMSRPDFRAAVEQAMQPSAALGQRAEDDPERIYSAIGGGVQETFRAFLAADRGGAPLSGEDVPRRLAALRAVLAELEATGTGYTLFYLPRRSNSAAYENVLTELRNQIGRMEANLPVGPNDDRRMIEALDAYTRNNETVRTSAFGQVRQRGMLRLYREFADRHAPIPEGGVPIPSREEVARRFNQARGARPGASDYVDLDDVAYAPVSIGMLADAGYHATLNELQERLSAGLTASDTRAAVEQGLYRAFAIRDVAMRDRAGELAAANEERITAATERVRRNAQIAAAIGKALTNAERANELLNVLRGADLRALSEAYLAEPERESFRDPLMPALRTLGYPTAAERLRLHLEGLLASKLITEGGRPLYKDRAESVVALRRLAAASEQGTALHVGDAQLSQAVAAAKRDLRLDEAIAAAQNDAALTRPFTALLSDETISVDELGRRISAFANGRVDAMVERERNEIAALPEGQALEAGENRDAVRDKLVRLAALHALRHEQNAAEAEREFTYQNLFTDDEIALAVSAVRQNAAFMDALEQRLTNTDAARRAADDIAAVRYERLLAEMRTRAASFARETDAAQRGALSEQLKRGFAELTALRAAQREGGLSALVSDEELASRANALLTSDGQLAIGFALERNAAQAQLLLDNVFNRCGASYGAAFAQHVTAAANAPAAPENGTLGQLYQLQQSALDDLDLQSAQGRADAAALVRQLLALRVQVLDEQAGLYATGTQQKHNEAMQGVESSAVYQSLLTRAENDAVIAQEVVTALRNESDLYALKTAQLRAQGGSFRDPLTARLNALTAFTAREYAAQGLSALREATEARGTAEQRDRLLQNLAQVLAARRCMDEEGAGARLSAEALAGRVDAILRGGDALAAALYAAADRGAFHGRGAELAQAVADAPSADAAEQAIYGFTTLTPEVWAAEAAQRLEQGSGAAREERIEAYARLHVMRLLAKDPQRAQQGVPLAELQAAARQYLGGNGVRAKLNAVFDRPETAGQSTVAARIARAEQSAPGETAAERLARMMALRGLENDLFPDALVSDAEVNERVEHVRQADFRYRLLTAAPNLDALAGKRGREFDVALENALYQLPAYRAFVLDGADERSFAGRSRLLADTLRHETTLAPTPEEQRAAFRTRLAELYTLSLYNDGGWPAEQLPNEAAIAEQAKRIANLSEFQDAVARLENDPAARRRLLDAVGAGVSPAQFAEQLNALADETRQARRSRDPREPYAPSANIAFSVQRDVMKPLLTDLLNPGVGDVWPEGKREHVFDTFLRAHAYNKLYVQQPERAFFTESEITAEIDRVRQDETFMRLLDRTFLTLTSLREIIFNYVGFQNWSTYDKIEDFRSTILQVPDFKAGLDNATEEQLTRMIWTKLTGRDAANELCTTAELAAGGQEVLFSEDFLAITNAMRADVAEYDRILRLISLSGERFRAAYRTLAAECRKKYPDAPSAEEGTVGWEYERAVERVRAAAADPSLATDAAKRAAFAADVSRALALRQAILSNRIDAVGEYVCQYGSALRENLTEILRNAQSRADAWTDGLADRLTEPAVAQGFVNALNRAGSLRRLPVLKRQADNMDFTDPLETALREQQLLARPRSAAERRAAVLAQIRAEANLPQEQRMANLRTHIAALYNLALYGDTAQDDMPDAAEFDAQVRRIAGLRDFGAAMDAYAQNPAAIAQLLQAVENGLDGEDFTAQLNARAAQTRRQQLGVDAPFGVNIAFDLRAAVINEWIERYSDIGNSSRWQHGQKQAYYDRFLRAQALGNLFAAHPNRLYFTAAERNAARERILNDPARVEQLNRSFTTPQTLRETMVNYTDNMFWQYLPRLEELVRDIARGGDEAETRQAGAQEMLAEALFLKLNGETDRDARLVLTEEKTGRVEELNATPEFRAIKRALSADYRNYDRVIRELLPLSGSAFRAKYREMTDEFRRDYPDPNAERQNPQAGSRPPVDPERPPVDRAQGVGWPKAPEKSVPVVRGDASSPFNRRRQELREALEGAFVAPQTVRRQFTLLYAEALLRKEGALQAGREPTAAQLDARIERLRDDALFRSFLDHAMDRRYALQMLDGAFAEPDADAMRAQMTALAPTQFEQLKLQLKDDVAAIKRDDRNVINANFARLYAVAILGAGQEHSDEEIDRKAEELRRSGKLEPIFQNLRDVVEDNDREITLVNRDVGEWLLNHVFGDADVNRIEQRLNQIASMQPDDVREMAELYVPEPQTLTVPEPRFADNPPMAEFQKQLLRFQAVNNKRFANKELQENQALRQEFGAALCKTVALYNLAHAPQYAGKSVDSAALQAEMQRLAIDPVMSRTLEETWSSHGNASLLIEGMMRTQDDPQHFVEFFKAVGMDASDSREWLNAAYPLPLKRFTRVRQPQIERAQQGRKDFRAPKYQVLPALQKPEASRIRNWTISGDTEADRQRWQKGSLREQYQTLLDGMKQDYFDNLNNRTPAYRAQLRQKVTRLYAMRQIMALAPSTEEAVPEDKRADVQNAIEQKCAELGSDKAFQAVLKGCEKNAQNESKIVREYFSGGKYPNLTELHAKLQSFSDQVLCKDHGIDYKTGLPAKKGPAV